MNRKGFTVIEVIIVLAVILVIGVLAAVAVNNARSKQRDATRLSQVRQVQSALEQFFNEVSVYPESGEGLLPLGDARASACLGLSGFRADCSSEEAVFLRRIPGTLDKGLEGLSICGNPPRNAFCYLGVEGDSDYRIQFELENNWSQVGLAQGLNCASPEGMSAGRCN